MDSSPAPIWVNRKKVFWVAFWAVFAPILLIWIAGFGYTVFFNARTDAAIPLLGILIVWLGIAALVGCATLGLVLGVLYRRHVLQFLRHWFTT
jgi:hypothetical protein